MSSCAAVGAVARREMPGLLSDGHSNTAIALEPGISDGGANVLVARRPRQANIKNRLEAAFWALQSMLFPQMIAAQNDVIILTVRLSRPCLDAKAGSVRWDTRTRQRRRGRWL